MIKKKYIEVLFTLHYISKKRLALPPNQGIVWGSHAEGDFIRNWFYRYHTPCAPTWFPSVLPKCINVPNESCATIGREHVGHRNDIAIHDTWVYVNISQLYRLQSRPAVMCHILGSGAWWRYLMETFSALLAICAGNSPVSGEFPAQRPVSRSFDVFFNRRLNKCLSKQSRGW